MAFVDHMGTNRKAITKAAVQYQTDNDASGGTQDDVEAIASSVADDTGGRLSSATLTTGRPSAAFSALAQPLEYLRQVSAISIDQAAQSLNRNDAQPGGDIVSQLVAIREYMIANSIEFESRAVTHGAPAAGGSNTGTGVLITHTDDDYGFELEAITDEVLTFTCVRDASTGATAGSEVFTVRGELPPRTLLERGGSQSGGETITAHCADNNQFIVNAGFNEAFSGSGADKISGWTITGTAGDISRETSTVFRGDSCLAFTDDVAVTQDMSGLPDDRPVLFSHRYSRNSTSVTGTMTLAAGSLSSAVTLSPAHASNWLHNYVVGWPREWSGAIAFSITLASGASFGTGLLIDECVIAPGVKIGGRWHFIIVGQTDFVLDDVFTQDSTIQATGTNKDRLHRFHGDDVEFPHDSTATTNYEDP
jgi:hypothetical protein